MWQKITSAMNKEIEQAESTVEDTGAGDNSKTKERYQERQTE